MRFPALFAFLAATLPGAFGQSQASRSSSPNSLEGLTIQEIRFTPAAQPLPRDELDRLLPLEPGEPLRMELVREAIQKLYATGRYSNIVIDGDQDPGSTGRVDLTIITEFKYFVSRVSIEGESDPPNRNQLITASGLGLGTEFREDQLDASIQGMQQRLRANGLYQSSIQHRVDLNPATEEASVYFDVETGDRAHFAGVDLSGEFERPVSSLIRATEWRRGLGPIPIPGWRELTEERLQNGLENLRRTLQQDDRLQARVTLDSLEYDAGRNRVTPHLAIDSGPIIEVRAPGADISRSRLRELLPIYQERTVDRSLLVEGQRNLTEYLQSQGYFDARVEFSQSTPQPGRSVIEYTVDRGDRHSLANIGFSGNQYFDIPTLRERMYIQPASRLRWRHGRYSPRALEQDVEAIANLYRSNGFREVQVTPTVTQDFQGEHTALSVNIGIDEGPQWFVENLEIEGATPEDDAYFRSTLRSTQGQPFSETNVAADRDAILTYYYNGGYTNATFDWLQEPGAEPNFVNLHYIVDSGEQQYVRSVLVRGLETTDASLVASRIALAPGDPISQSQIGQSQQRLYDLGIFAKVETAIQNPEGQEESKNVLFYIDEASKYSFNFGVGAEVGRIGGGTTTFDSPAGAAGFAPRVSVGLSRINFLGLGHTVALQTLASTRQRRALLNYLAPQFKGNENLQLTFSALFDDSHDVRTFTARRWEGSVQLAQRLTRANTLQFRYSFRRVTLDENSLNISPDLIPLFSRPVRVGQVAFSFFQDRRDDPVDTHRGIYNSIDFGVAAGIFGSQSDFTRLLIRNTTYHPLGREVTIARTVQFGYIERLGGITEIPLSERFYAGGASSHRAFPDNQAGPRDLETGFPVGGEALLFHSTELRFPLIGDNIGGVIFHDMGNVFADVGSISFRAVQHDLQDFNYMVHGAGFGIRYRTPVGPLRIDLSYGPNSPRFFGFRGTRDQLLAGQGEAVNQRINRFQFHFSLGQTF